jgi:hypothetical protein
MDRVNSTAGVSKLAWSDTCRAFNSARGNAI